jgi:hypothetical protein
VQPTRSTCSDRTASCRPGFGGPTPGRTGSGAGDEAAGDAGVTPTGALDERPAADVAGARAASWDGRTTATCGSWSVPAREIVPSGRADVGDGPDRPLA